MMPDPMTELLLLLGSKEVALSRLYSEVQRLTAEVTKLKAEQAAKAAGEVRDGESNESVGG